MTANVPSELERVARAIWSAHQDAPNGDYALKLRMSYDEAIRAAQAAIDAMGVERMREALDRIQGHSTERPCMTATEHTERTLDEVQQIARQALSHNEEQSTSPARL